MRLISGALLCHSPSDYVWCAVHFPMPEQIQVLSEALFYPLITANGPNKALDSRPKSREPKSSTLRSLFLIASWRDLVSVTYSSCFSGALMWMAKWWLEISKVPVKLDSYRGPSTISVILSTTRDGEFRDQNTVFDPAARTISGENPEVEKTTLRPPCTTVTHDYCLRLACTNCVTKWKICTDDDLLKSHHLLERESTTLEGGLTAALSFFRSVFNCPSRWAQTIRTDWAFFRDFQS